MKQLTIYVLAALALFCVAVQAKNPQKKIAAKYSYESECLGVELDGSQTLHSWGKGRTISDAIEQAKKNAVRDVLFKGILNGNGECNKKPIIFEVNAQEKYEDYFNAFFKDGGAYKEFVTSEDGSIWRPETLKNHKESGAEEAYRINVRVLRTELKARMIADKILIQ